MLTHAKHEKKILRAQSGTARAALLGISDGLTTNVALILGVAGAGVDVNFVRIAGLASLIAGACSMAVGEYVSMRGQIEMLSSVLAIEHEEFKSDPEAAKAALQGVFKRDGLTDQTAAKATEELLRDEDKALAVYIRQRFGLNANELGAAWGSGISSLIMFGIGAAIPLIPWYLTSGAPAVLVSLGASAAAALIIGGYLGYTNTGRWLFTALRQLLVVAVASGVTFLIGRIFHTTIA